MNKKKGVGKVPLRLFLNFMWAIIRFVLFAVGLLFVIYSVATLTYSNFSAAQPILIGVGIAFILLVVLPRSNFKRYYEEIMKVCLTAALFILAVIIFCGPAPADGTEDAVIVLGCAVKGEKPSNTLYARTAAATRYYKMNSKAVFVLSGGQGSQESISEAEALERVLLECGIPKEQLIKEERATSTSENFAYSKAILDEYFDGEYKTAFVTNDFHSYRAGKIAKFRGFENVTVVEARTPISSVPLCYVREVFAVIKLWILHS